MEIAEKLSEIIVKVEAGEAQPLDFYSALWEKGHLLGESFGGILERAKNIASLSPATHSWQLFSEGMQHVFVPNTGNAYKKLSDAWEAFAKTGNQTGQGGADALLALYFKSIGQMEKAQMHALRAIQLMGKGGNEFVRFQAAAYYQAGEISRILKDYEAAIGYFEKGAHIPESNQYMLARFLNGIGNVYGEKNDHEKALECFQLSLKEGKIIGDFLLESKNYADMGRLYAEKGDFENAASYYRQSIGIRTENKQENALTTNYLDMADLFLKQGKYGEALRYAEISKGRGEQQNEPLKVYSAHRIISAVYEAMGDHVRALEHYKTFHRLEDEVQNQENSKAIKQMAMHYEIESMQKENEIANLRNVELKQANEELMATLQLVEDERRVSERLLLNILPADTARELRQNGSVKPKYHPAASVLFTDFKGFTQLAEHMAPEDLIKSLDECFQNFDEICKANGLEKIKTIGDSYMAAAGIPLPNQLHARQAVKTGLEILGFMEAWQAKRQSAGLPIWQIRIGIHSGEVIAGVIGLHKFAYDVWGDTVNTASRMESSGEPGKLNISESTYRLLDNQFQCAFRGKISAKNKKDMPMYFVIGENS